MPPCSSRLCGAVVLLAALLLPFPLAAADWISQDIGGPMPGSTKQPEAGGFDIVGCGKDIWDTSDSFRFVYQKVSGDFDFRARIMSVQNTDEWAKAGIMVRQSTVPGSIHANLVASASHGCVFQRRLEAGAEMLSTDCGSTRPGGTWVRLMRSGKAVTAHIASDEAGTKWQRVGADSVELNDPVLVGMCVSSHNTGTLCSASFRGVVLTSESTPSDPVAAAAAAGAGAAADPPKAAMPGLSTLDSSAAKPPVRQPAREESSATAAQPAGGETKRGDPSLASALASGAAKLASEGKQDKAREMCFRALANYEDSPEALYELGKIFEKEGKAIAAGDFLARAARMLAREEGANPAFASKRTDAERRVKTLNPYATRLTEALTDYSLALGMVVKKVPDSMTQEEAADRVGTLQLANFVPPEKLPKIDKVVSAAPKETVKRVVDEDGFIRTVKKEVVTNIPPDVERTLKTNGWTTITGTWKKKADGVYEVTDGKLETPKVNGALQVLIHKGGTGKVKVMVRDNQRDSRYYYSSSSYSSSGYGFWVESGVAKMYSAVGTYYFSSSGGVYKPYFERDIAASLPKNKILIQINGGKLEMFVNEKREHNSNYKLGADGPFVIEVEGTWTIEDPKAGGQ